MAGCAFAAFVIHHAGSSKFFLYVPILPKQAVVKGKAPLQAALFSIIIEKYEQLLRENKVRPYGNLDEVKAPSELAPEVTDLHDALAIERSRVRLRSWSRRAPVRADDAADMSGAVFAEMGELKDRLEQYSLCRPCVGVMPKRCWKCVRKTTTLALARECRRGRPAWTPRWRSCAFVTLLNGEYDEQCHPDLPCGARAAQRLRTGCGDAACTRALPHATTGP